ncbi:MAG TPA: enoyl-CoA hydratase/isomerase family protein [Rhodococcus sp. (in: high G+C Gram-positive bacteria)]|nr:enoyl-CoA hydratase/isomerase family protein [Rhodococcus sp. (in: high G+C Gram-positive bacteria)]
MTAVVVSTPIAGVVQVTMNRPDALNTLTSDSVAEFRSVLADIAADRSCRVVVLTGDGRAFSAGLDLHGYGDEDRIAAEGAVGRMLSRQRDIAGLAQQLHELPQPVIAAVNGPAAGGGLALVCASDIRLAATSAVFAVSFIRAGFSACDIGVSWLLPRIVGAGPAHELMLTGRRFDASEAHRIGLVTAVFDPEELLASALAKAQQIMLNPPLSVELTKQGMWIALETPSFDSSVEFENRQQVFTALTEDRGEATAAFLERRPHSYRRR